MMGLAAVAEKGMTKVVLKTDSMMLVEALKKDSHKLSAMGGLILEDDDQLSF